MAALRLAGAFFAAAFFLAGLRLAAFFLAGLRLAAFFLAGAFFAAAFFLAGLRLAAFFAGALATAFFLAALRLAGALRAVVFLAATGPPRGKTLGRPEGSYSQGWQTKLHFGAFFANKVTRVSHH